MKKINFRFLNIFLFSISLSTIYQPIGVIAHSTPWEKTPEKLEKINYWTDYFFYLARPEMRGKKIQHHHSLYRQEQIAIRKVVRQIVFSSCQRPNINHYYFLTERDNHKPRYLYRHRNIDRDRSQGFNYRYNYPYYDKELSLEQAPDDLDYYWVRNKNYFFAGLYHDLTDALFYARHPEFSRQVSRKSTMNLTSEWIFIRQHFADFEQEQFIKQNLIPLCTQDFQEESIGLGE